MRRINEVKPHLLLVAFGAPAQEMWIAKHLGEMPSVRVAIGVGGTFVIGIGSLLVGAVLMAAWSTRAASRPFFRGESLNAETAVLVPENPESYPRSVDGGL